MFIEMWRVFVGKIDQNVYSSTEFNFDICYSLALCELRRRDQGRSHNKLMASGFSSSDCPVGTRNSTKGVILQASNCTHHFELLVFESSLETITNDLKNPA